MLHHACALLPPLRRVFRLVTTKNSLCVRGCKQTKRFSRPNPRSRRICVRSSRLRTLRITTMTRKAIVIVSCWMLVSVCGASAIRIRGFDSARTTLEHHSTQPFARGRRALLSGTDAKVIDTVWSALHRADGASQVEVSAQAAGGADSSAAATSLFSSLETFPSAAPRVESASFDGFTDVDRTNSQYASTSSDDAESAVRASIMRDRLARAASVAALFGAEPESLLTTLTGNTILSSLLTDPSVISFIAALISGDDGVATSPFG
jgi:hypothetical protein